MRVNTIGELLDQHHPVRGLVASVDDAASAFGTPHLLLFSRFPSFLPHHATDLTRRRRRTGGFLATPPSPPATSASPEERIADAAAAMASTSAASSSSSKYAKHRRIGEEEEEEEEEAEEAEEEVRSCMLGAIAAWHGQRARRDRVVRVRLWGLLWSDMNFSSLFGTSWNWGFSLIA